MHTREYIYTYIYIYMYRTGKCGCVRLYYIVQYSRITHIFLSDNTQMCVQIFVSISVSRFDVNFLFISIYTPTFHFL